MDCSDYPYYNKTSCGFRINNKELKVVHKYISYLSKNVEIHPFLYDNKIIFHAKQGKEISMLIMVSASEVTLFEQPIENYQLSADNIEILNGKTFNSFEEFKDIKEKLEKVDSGFSLESDYESEFESYPLVRRVAITE